MKGKAFLFAAASAVIVSGNCLGDWVPYECDDARTGKKTMFWGDASSGKALMLSFDKENDVYYFEKVKSNKPKSKDDKDEGKKAKKEPKDRL